MPIKPPSYAPTKIAIVVWGCFSVLKGAALDYARNEHAPFAQWAQLFIGIVYFSVLVGGLFSFVSSRMTAIALGVVTIISLLILLGTQPFNDGLGLGSEFGSLLAAIAMRPLLLSLVLFTFSRFERRSLSKFEISNRSRSGRH